MCDTAQAFLTYIYRHYYQMPYPGEEALLLASFHRGNTLTELDMEVAYSLVSDLYESGLISGDTKVLLKYGPPILSTVSMSCPGIVTLSPFVYNRLDSTIQFSKWFFLLHPREQQILLIREITTIC